LISRQADILFLQSNIEGIRSLQFLEALSHVVSRAGVIEVGGFIDVLYVLAGHLQNGEDVGLVSSRRVELSLRVFQVLFVDLQEEVGSEGP
jgi:hypothetical protein